MSENELKNIRIQDLTQKEFRQSFDVPINMEMYTGIEKAYWTTNESFIHAYSILATEDLQPANLNYFGVLGGLDAALSHIAAIHQPDHERLIDSAVLTDINDDALLLGQSRLDLVTVSANPISYLQSIIPADIDFNLFTEISDSEQIDQLMSKSRFKYNPKRMISNLLLAGYSLEQSTYIANNVHRADYDTFTINAKEGTLKLGEFMICLVMSALLDEQHWLSIKNPENYQKIRELHLQGRIKTLKAPIQSVATDKLFNLYSNIGLDYIYLSNINGFMGNNDYKVMLNALRVIGRRKSTDPKIIFARYNGDREKVAHLPNQIVRLSEVDEKAELIRHERERFDEMLTSNLMKVLGSLL